MGDLALAQNAAMQRALQQLKDALELLDSAEAPADVGAHVDLAIHRLEARLEASQDRQPAPGARSVAR